MTKFTWWHSNKIQQPIRFNRMVWAIVWAREQCRSSDKQVDNSSWTHMFTGGRQLSTNSAASFSAPFYNKTFSKNCLLSLFSLLYLFQVKHSSVRLLPYPTLPPNAFRLFLQGLQMTSMLPKPIIKSHLNTSVDLTQLTTFSWKHFLLLASGALSLASSQLFVLTSSR